MSKSLVDPDLLMRSVLGEAVMVMDVPPQAEDQSAVQAKLGRDIRLKSPAPITDTEPTLTVHSDDEDHAKGKARKRRSIKSKATVELEDDDDDPPLTDKRPSKGRSTDVGRTLFFDTEAIESDTENAVDPKGKGKAKAKDTPQRKPNVQSSASQAEKTRLAAFNAMQEFAKQFPGYMSSEGVFHFKGDAPVMVKTEPGESSPRPLFSSKQHARTLETIDISTDDDSRPTKHGYKRDGFVVDSDEDHSDASNQKRRKKARVEHETSESDELPEPADMFKTPTKQSKEPRKPSEDEYQRYEEDNEAEGADERLAAQGRKPKTSSDVDSVILEAYSDKGHPLSAMYANHPNARLQMSKLTPSYRVHNGLEHWTFSFNHPALKRFNHKGLQSFVAFLSFVREDMFANVGNCNPNTFSMGKYESGQSIGYNLIFADTEGIVVSLEVGLSVASNLRTPFNRTAATKTHSIAYVPLDQNYNLLTAVLGDVFGFGGDTHGGPFTTIEMDDTERLVLYSSTYATPVTTPDPSWRTLPYPDLTRAGANFMTSPPKKTSSIFASTSSQASPPKAVGRVAYPATQSFTTAIPIFDGTAGIIPGEQLWKSLKANSLKIYKDGKQEVPDDSLIVVGNCINTYPTQNATALSFNVQFIIILALPPSSVPDTPQKRKESNSPAKKRKQRHASEDAYVPSTSSRPKRSQK